MQLSSIVRHKRTHNQYIVLSITEDKVRLEDIHTNRESEGVHGFSTVLVKRYNFNVNYEHVSSPPPVRPFDYLNQLITKVPIGTNPFDILKNL